MHIYGTSHLQGPHMIQPAGLNRTSGAAVDNTLPRDEVQISDMGQMLDRIHDMPEIRQDRVAAARQAIASGVYDSPERFEAAVERLLDELV